MQVTLTWSIFVVFAAAAPAGPSANEPAGSAALLAPSVRAAGYYHPHFAMAKKGALKDTGGDVQDVHHGFRPAHFKQKHGKDALPPGSVAHADDLSVHHGFSPARFARKNTPAQVAQRMSDAGDQRGVHHGLRPAHFAHKHPGHGLGATLKKGAESAHGKATNMPHVKLKPIKPEGAVALSDITLPEDMDLEAGAPGTLLPEEEPAAVASNVTRNARDAAAVRYAGDHDVQRAACQHQRRRVVHGRRRRVDRGAAGWRVQEGRHGHVRGACGSDKSRPVTHMRCAVCTTPPIHPWCTGGDRELDVRAVHDEHGRLVCGQHHLR